MREAKTIVVFSEYFYPMFCGVPTSSRNIARSLSSLGHRVTVYTPLGLGNHSELEEGYEIVRGKHWKKLGKSSKVDIVLINNGNFSSKGYLLGRWLGAQIIQWYQMTHVPRVKVSLKSIFNGIAEKLTIGKIHAFVGVSELALSSRPWIPVGKTSKVIFNCGESLFTEFPIPRGPKSHDLVFVGRMTEAKGMLVLKSALETLEADKVPLKLLMVGDGDLKAVLEDHFRDYAYVDVAFAGVKRGADLVSCYDSARAFLFTTTTHPEGLPLVLGEAAMRGLVILSSDHPVAVEAVGGLATIYKRDSPEQLASAIRNFLAGGTGTVAGPSELDEIRSRFSFDRLGQQLEELIPLLGC